MQKTFTPEFNALMQQYRDTSAGLGDDHPLARRLWLIVMATAPDWFVDEMSAMAKDMDLIPEPCACDDTGQKFYSLDALASKLGLSADEVAQQMAMLQADAAAAGLPDAMRTTGARELHPLHCSRADTMRQFVDRGNLLNPNVGEGCRHFGAVSKCANSLMISGNFRGRHGRIR